MSRAIDRIPAMTRTRAVKAPEGPATTPRGIKVQHGPSHPIDERYQVDPKSKPYGAGFSAVGIGRSVIDGRPWEGA